MNIEKYTERARGFIQSAQGIATRQGNQGKFGWHRPQDLAGPQEEPASGQELSLIHILPGRPGCGITCKCPFTTT